MLASLSFRAFSISDCYSLNRLSTNTNIATNLIITIIQNILTVYNMTTSRLEKDIEDKYYKLMESYML